MSASPPAIPSPLKKKLAEIYHQLNHPQQAGRVWVRYTREQINEVLPALREIVEETP